MHATLQTPSASAYEFGDMNGPLSYWGPIEGHTIAEASRQTIVPATDLAALRELGRTLHGRTWAGTNALMSAIFAGMPGSVAA